MSLIGFELNWSWKIIHHWNIVLLKFPWLSFFCCFVFLLCICPLPLHAIWSSFKTASSIYDDLTLWWFSYYFEYSSIHSRSDCFCSKESLKKSGSYFIFRDMTPRTVCIKQHFQFHLLCSHRDKSYLACHLSVLSTSIFFLIAKLCRNPNKTFF